MLKTITIRIVIAALVGAMLGVLGGLTLSALILADLEFNTMNDMGDLLGFAAACSVFGAGFGLAIGLLVGLVYVWPTRHKPMKAILKHIAYYSFIVVTIAFTVSFLGSHLIWRLLGRPGEESRVELSMVDGSIAITILSGLIASYIGYRRLMRSE